MDDAPCIVHGSTLDHMFYSLMTTLGLSVKTYSNTHESKVYGTGQGSTCPPPAWGQIVSKLFDAHGKRAHGATYQSPDGRHELFLHMLGFVDDTKNHVNDMMCPHPLSVDALVTLMAEDSQLWSDLLHGAGTALECNKLYFYVSYWKFEPSGRPYLDATLKTTIPVSSPDRSTTVHKSGSELIVRTGMAKILTQYRPSALNRRLQSFPKKSTATVVPVLPANSVPIDPPQNFPRHWRVPTGVGTNALRPPFPRLPATAFAARIAALEPSLQDLLTNVVLLLPLPEIFTLLRIHPILTLVGDGGAKTCRGSFGAVAAINTIRILTVAGTVAGPDPWSYRSEGYAMAAIVLAITILLDTLSLPRPCRFAIQIFSDKEGLVKRIASMQKWETVYPSSALLSKWDILSVILTFLKKLPSAPLVQHVTRHQDDDQPVHLLPLSAQLNCEADVLTILALDAIPSPIPVVPIFPSAMCHLDIREETITCRHASALCWSATNPAMIEYVCARNDLGSDYL
jgi:hypothetical protein